MAEHAKKQAGFVADDRRRRGATDFLIDASHFAHETSGLPGVSRSEVSNAFFVKLVDRPLLRVTVVVQMIRSYR